MNDALANLTPAALTCIDTARHNARVRQSARVEPEHLLMAMLHPEAGGAWNFLVGMLGDPLPLRKPAEAALADLPLGEPEQAPALSYRIERVLSGAGDVARRAGTSIDSHHLLVGVLEEGGAAANILRQAGLDARALRGWLRQRTGAPSAAAVPRAASPRAESTRGRGAPQLRPFARPAARPASRSAAQPVVTGPLWAMLPRLINWWAVFTMLGMMGVGAWLTTQAENETAGVFLFVLGGYIFSVCAHEFGHALAADLGGDQSVREKGYLSFNPLRYAHPLLSIVMPLVFLLIGGIGLPGGAVYVERDRLRGPGWNSIVSAAGPLAELVVTLIFAAPFLLNLVRPSMILAAPELWGALALVVMLNVWAILLNLIPIPPLDGFGILAAWLSPEVRNRLYLFGLIGPWILIFGLLSIPSVRESFWGTIFNVLQAMNVDPGLASYGLTRFWFWRS